MASSEIIPEGGVLRRRQGCRQAPNSHQGAGACPPKQCAAAEVQLSLAAEPGRLALTVQVSAAHEKPMQLLQDEAWLTCQHTCSMRQGQLQSSSPCLALDQLPGSYI